MGLLDDLLGGLAGQAMGRRANAQATRAGGGAGMSQVLMALMPVVLGMLANRGSRGGSQVPDADKLANSVDDFARRLGLS